MDERLKHSLNIAAPTLLIGALAIHTAVAFSFFYTHAPSVQWRGPLLGPSFLSEWTRHLGRLLALGLWSLSLPGLGGLLLRKSSPGGLSLVFRTATGLLLWAGVGFAAGAFGASSPGVLRPLSLVLVAAGLWKGRRLWRAPAISRALILPGLFVFLYGLTTVVPETFYDALVYHLAVPEAYLKIGRWVDFPDIHLTRLPGLVQPIYLWGLAWGDTRWCKLQSALIGGVAAWAVGLWTRDRFGAPSGFWAGTLLLSLPLIGINLWSCANDLLAGLFLFLAFARWTEEDTNDRTRVFVSGLFLGAAAAAKLTALSATPFFLWELLKNGRRTSWSSLGVFGGAALLPLLPWWIRNGLWTGNPFYPLATSWLRGDLPENIALLSVWKADAQSAAGWGERLASFVIASVKGVQQGRFGFLGPTLLMPLLFLFKAPRTPVLRSLALMAGISYGSYVLASGYLRYFIPGLFFVAPLAAVALGTLAPRWAQRLTVVAVLLNGLWLILAFQTFNQGWSVVGGHTLPNQYLREEHIGVYGHPTQGAYDFLRSIQAQGKVLVLGEARTVGCPLPAVASGNFNKPTFARWLDDTPDPRFFEDRLRREGFTYVVLNGPELLRITQGPYRDDAHLRALNAVLARLGPPLYQDRWTVVLAVTPP